MSKHDKVLFRVFTEGDVIAIFPENQMSKHTKKPTFDEMVARARLRNAAPELLKVAKAALISLEAANEVLGGWATEEYYIKVRRDLRKVIAKAEGTDE